MFGKKQYHFVVTEITNGKEHAYAATLDENDDLILYTRGQNIVKMNPSPSRKAAEESAKYLNSALAWWDNKAEEQDKRIDTVSAWQKNKVTEQETKT